MYYNTLRFSALAVSLALALFSAPTIAGSSTQRPGEQTEASLLTAADAIPDVVVVLKKKPDVQLAAAPPPTKPAGKGLGKSAGIKSNASRAATARPTDNRGDQTAGNNKTNKDGSFSFENVPTGTYNLTFDAPKVSPALAGKVEYLVIVQQVAADSSASITYDDTKPKTARIPVAKINDGLDFTVAPPPGHVFQASESSTKKKAGATNSQTRKPKDPPEPMRTPLVNLRGKIFLVEIGTTKIVRDSGQAH